MRYTTVGVTGHIDHGKTSLVGVLTGIDTDTHPEEKRRGITIDLGFASLTEAEHTFAFIDAPGHQKYVGNLLAGVSAVDVGLLVVASDQGIQQQTLEHAGILKTLGVPKLLVALSRIDLVDEAKQAEVREELEVFLSDFGFDEIPVIPVSSITLQGIPELKSALSKAGTEQLSIEQWRAKSPFRMPIDRVLNVPGRGLVVAGTVWRGAIQIGDMVQIAGGEEALRVRELEVHGEMVSESRLGVRTAVNLSGTLNRPVSRGDELVQEDGYERCRKLVVEVEMYPEVAQVKCPATIQLHTGTTACGARVIGPPVLEANGRYLAVVEPESPVIACFGQPCLFRRPYPVGAIGGARVLAGVIEASRKNRDMLKLGTALQEASPDRESMLAAWVELSGEFVASPTWCEQYLDFPADQAASLIERCGKLEGIVPIGDSLVAESHVKRIGKHILKMLEARASENDDTWVVVQSIEERSKNAGSKALIRYALKQLIDAQAIVEMNGRLALASDKTMLSKKQRARMGVLLEQLTTSRTPPSVKELAATLGVTEDAICSLARHACHQGLLTEYAPLSFIGTEVWMQLQLELEAVFEQQADLSASEIKDAWGISRKYAIPLLEYCDKMKLTVRAGDKRCAGPALQSRPSAEA